MHPRRRLPLVASLVPLIATTGRTPTCAGRLFMAASVGQFARVVRPELPALLEALLARVEAAGVACRTGF